MKIAFIASEATPYAKTGGLADVVGALPISLRQLGLDVAVFLPRYNGIEGTLCDHLSIEMGKRYEVDIYKDNDFYFIDYPDFFKRARLYGTEKGDFPDNCERFTLFSKVVSELILRGSYDIVHCHDWQTGLVPLYLNSVRAQRRAFLRSITWAIRVVFLRKNGRFLDLTMSILHLKVLNIMEILIS